MVAKSQRLAIRDSVLIALSVAVTVLAWWPRSEPRQRVHVRDAETGNPQSFAIPLSDSRLAEIRQQAYNRAHPRPRTEWVLARWRSRLATHYIAHSSPQDAHWMGEHARAERTIDAEAQRFAQQRLAAQMPAVAMGEIIDGPRRRGAWMTAVAGGLLAAIGFVHWAVRWPALTAIAGSSAPQRAALSTGRRPPDEAPQPAAVEPTDAIRVEVPANWIRVSQPLPVSLRRGAMTLVVATALVSLWL